MDLGGDCTNEAVLYDILRRLPVKSLVRFMCVSKSWSDLISGSSFINSHLRFNKSLFAKSHAVLGLTSCSFEYYKLANSDNLHQTLEHVEIPCPWRQNPQLPEPRPEKPKMVDGKVITKIRRGSCITGHHNGLICAYDVEKFSVFTKSSNGKYGTKDIIDVEKLIICNPITRRFKILPDSDIEIPELPIREDDYMTYRSLLYKRLQVVGFGFVDEVAYKVVRVTYGMGDRDSNFRQFQPPWVEVYDSRSDSWRRVFVDHNLSCKAICGNTNNFLDGSLYWLGFGYQKNRDYRTLVSFNLVEEKLSELLLDGWSDNNNEDDYFSEYDRCIAIAILGESVALFVGDRRNDLLLRVWKMDKKEGEVSWTKMYRFNFRVHSIGFCRDGELILCPKDSPELILYDPKKMEDGCNVDCLDLGIQMGNVDVTDFVESLLLLDGATCNTEEEMDSIAEETPDTPEETEKEEEEEEEVFELGVFFDEN